MRSSALVGVTLTILMLLLVSVAAFIFLFQGRQTLESRNQSLAGELETTKAEQEAASGTRGALAVALATVESDSILLEGQLVQSQQEIDELTTALTETGNALGLLEQERLDMLARPPQVNIVSPVEGVTLLAGSQVEIVVAAADPVGVTEMMVWVDGRLLGSYVANGLPLLSVTESWMPAESGSFVLEVEASNGRTSTIVTRTLSVSEPISQLSTVAIDPNSALRADIEASVSELRGLRPLPATVTTIITSAELAERVQPAQLWDSEAIPAVLSVFDFVTGSYNVANAPTQFQSRTSYYDAAANEMLVAGDVGEWTASDQLAYVQQFVRQLQDQNFDLDAINTGTLDYDARLALAALSFGETSYIQNVYLRGDYFSEAELNLIFDNLAQTPSNDSIPIFTSEQQFREVNGIEFVQSLINIGQFDAVEAAWKNPPLSTEQVLHPQKYLDGEGPDAVDIPMLGTVLGDGWVQLVDDSFGELWLRAYLLQQLNAEQVETAVTGWGGGQFTVYGHNSGDALAMVLWLTWDTPTDSVEFAALYPNYPTKLFNSVGALQSDGSECWQGIDTICLYQRDDVTFIVRAPDLETAVTIAAEVENN
ncbi:MAG: hypothetical protein DWQ04_26755 [Chloroflexi bacterium]|nr:MAG: hypothetical protein DWQ04_26755 [Chloroflexota bacterium]